MLGRGGERDGGLAGYDLTGSTRGWAGGGMRRTHIWEEDMPVIEPMKPVQAIFVKGWPFPVPGVGWYTTISGWSLNGPSTSQSSARSCIRLPPASAVAVPHAPYSEQEPCGTHIPTSPRPDRTGWDGMGWDGMGWDGMEETAKCHRV